MNVALNQKQQKRIPTWAIIIITVTLACLVIGGSLYALYTSIFGTTVGCFDAVTQISKDLNVSAAGTIQQSETYDGGGISNCADPTMLVTISGQTSSAHLIDNLTNAGFTKDSPSSTENWRKHGAQIRLNTESSGNTSILIRALNNWERYQ